MCRYKAGPDAAFATASFPDMCNGYTMKSCLLFDIDGTLTDSDHYHFIAFNEMLARHNVQVTRDEFIKRISGKSNAVIFADLLPHVPAEYHSGLADAKEAEFRKLAHTLSPLPGLIELLDWADANNIDCGAVTNAPRANAEHMLSALGLEKRFKVLVLAEELEYPKPHPLPYLTGLKLLGAEASVSVGFEDSESGLKAAVDSGLTSIGIMTSLKRDAVLATGAKLAAANYQDGALLNLIKSTIRV